MKSIVTHPDFQALPKGLKRMLVTSEHLFFAEARTQPAGSRIPSAQKFGGVSVQPRGKMNRWHWN